MGKKTHLRGIPFSYQSLDGVPRPILAFKLINPDTGQTAVFAGLVDTGSPYCIAADYVGIAVGHKIDSGQTADVTGATLHKLEAFVHHNSKIQIQMCDHKKQISYLPPIDCPFRFMRRPSGQVPSVIPDGQPWGSPFAILGAEPVMKAYKFMFDYSGGTFAIIY